MKPFSAMGFYRLSRFLYLKKVPIIPRIIKFINRTVFACDIPFKADIDRTVHFSHNALGVVINDNTKIGSNTKILQNVTLGGNMGKKKKIEGKLTSAPNIGKNVIVGAGAQILGPVKIGDNAKIGAGAVVIIDIPDNMTAVGVPAKIIES